MIGLLANSILSFASCLAKGTNNNDAKNNIIRIHYCPDKIRNM